MEIHKLLRDTYPRRRVIGLLLVVMLGSLGVGILFAAVQIETAAVLFATSLGVVVFGLVVVPICARRPAAWVVVLLLALALVPNSSVIVEKRVLGEGFKLFTRHLAGVLSIWDVLLLVLFGFILIDRLRLFSPVVKPNQLLRLLFGAWFLAALNGLAHAAIWRYGFTSFRSIVQQTLPIVYLVLSYLLVRVVLVERRDIDLVVRGLYLCNILILIQGSVLFGLSVVGLFPAMPGFLGIPIVLYGQLMFLALGVNWTFAKWVGGQRVSLLEWVIFIGGTFFLLMSTRRLVLLTLLFNCSVIWFLGAKHRLSVGMLLRVTLLVLVTMVPVVMVASILVPQFVDAMSLVAQSYDMTSDVGRFYGGVFRMAQIESLFLNLNEQAPFSYVWGMGLGTYWYEYVSMGLPMDRGTTAYVESVLETGWRGWWPGFHLSYISLFYRYGVGGMIFLVAVVGNWFLSWLRRLRRLPRPDQPLALMIIVMGAQVLLAMGDSLDSAWPALFGIWIGVLEALARQPVEIAAKPSASRQPVAGVIHRVQDEV